MLSNCFFLLSLFIYFATENIIACFIIPLNVMSFLYYEFLTEGLKIPDKKGHDWATGIFFFLLLFRL